MSTWPTRLWLVRHGESAGNLALLAAEAAGSLVIELTGRDMDVPLSALGKRQARAVGAWFNDQPTSERPTVVLSSPYVRAHHTAACIAEEGEFATRVQCVQDERLREKEFGALNRLTKAGILARFPGEAQLRAEVGKFHYRPPGGESWCDVLLRLRSVLHDAESRYANERVLIVAHQVIVLCFRYLLEGLDEEALLAIDRAGDVANCSITSYEISADPKRPGMNLKAYNFVAPLLEAGGAVTRAPDAAVAK